MSTEATTTTTSHEMDTSSIVLKNKLPKAMKSNSEDLSHIATNEEIALPGFFVPEPTIPNTLISEYCESEMSFELYDIAKKIYYEHIITREELRNMVQLSGKNEEEYIPFKLDESFLKHYRNTKPPFGFDGVGEFTYLRTYARVVIDPISGEKYKECWFDTIKRVVEGTMNLLKRHIDRVGSNYCNTKAIKIGENMFDMMFNMKFLPPGRGLWAMGTPITEKEGLYAALNNCGFVSTENIDVEGATPFVFMMDMLMLGCGVGFDARGSGKVKLHIPDKTNTLKLKVGDTREGWVVALGLLIDSYINEKRKSIEFDFSKIREKGAPLKNFGGIAPGPEPLKTCIDKIQKLLENKIEQCGKDATVDMREIVDIGNIIGACVQSGNIRRAAEIVFGEHDDQEYIDLKDYEKNPERSSFGYASNNSIIAKNGMDYSAIAKSVYKNGEPGIMWLENAREYGRMSGRHKDHMRKDLNACGGNPCLEQTLESNELCDLVETFPNNFENFEEAKKVIGMAFLFAKIVSLGKIHWKKTDKIVQKNHRMGISMSGIVQAISKFGETEFWNMCDKLYDEIQYKDEVYSSWLRCNKSIKTTSVKPSGTVSLLAGATPGIHDPTFKTYIRRIRLSKNSPLVNALEEAGYPTPDCPYNPLETCAVEFPVSVASYGVKSERETTMLEKFERIAKAQAHWADNQVSATVSFDKEQVSEKDIVAVLDHYQHRLKGISFYPMGPIGQYKMPPYSPISEKEYEERKAAIKPIEFSKYMKVSDPAKPMGCTSEKCSLDFN